MKHDVQKTIRDYAITVAFAASIALLIRAYVIEAYQIPSFSMKPTLLSGDTIFVAKWPTWFQSLGLRKEKFPARGDVIVFSSEGKSNSPKLEYIKRVIGLPGDEIALKNGSLFLNGQRLEEPIHPLRTEKLDCPQEKLPDGKTYQICRGAVPFDDFDPIKIKNGFFFAIGDYRAKQGGSEKLKTWDLVPFKSIKGKALAVWLSIDKHREFGAEANTFPRFRFERMFKRIN